MTENTLRDISFVVPAEHARYFEEGLDRLSEAGTVYQRDRVEPTSPIKGSVVISVRGIRLDPAMELQANLANTKGDIDSDRVTSVVGEIVARDRLNQENPRMATATSPLR